MPLHEAFGLRYRWRARAEAILSYKYWRGVVGASREASLSLDELHALAPPAGAPAMTVDLAEGIDVARELLTIRPGLPVVLASGYLKEEEVAAALAIGVREVVLKPNTVDQLGHIIDQLIGRAVDNDKTG